MAEDSLGIFKPLFDDIDSEISNRAAPLLAHYTSIGVVESILSKTEIWFSNPLFLNDHEELGFGMKEGLSSVFDSKDLKNALKTDDRLNRFIDAYRDLHFQFENENAIKTFVLSLCEHEQGDQDGKLSMWRAYGASGNGACIVFDSSKVPLMEDSPLIFDKVEYETSAIRSEKIRSFIAIVCHIIDQQLVPDDRLRDAAYRLFERIKLYSLFTKHIGFKEEKEWRVVYFSERDPNNILEPMIGYEIGNRGLEPKLKLKLSPIDGVLSVGINIENLIHSILLGPSNSTPLAIATARRMLIKLKLETLVPKLFGSSIPFRGP